MSDKELIEQIEAGKMIAVNKKSIAWGAVVTLLIFIITQSVLFGIWKGSVDSKLDENNTSMRRSEIEIQKLKHNSKIIGRLEHNLIRLLEKNNMAYDYNFGVSDD